MESVTISRKFQVVIPKKIRNSLNLKPGQKVQLVQYEGRIELVPIHDIKDLRGFVKEIDTKFERGTDRV
jgi:AbrB family looped-hinge helix DNA binding protein